MDQQELFQITSQLKKLLIKVGEEILLKQNDRLQIKVKEDGSKVTESDLLAEKLISDYLKKNFDFSIISEEKENSSLENQLTWVIDPIDGTSSYIKQKKSFSIMLGLMKNRSPIWSMIYLPAQGLGYYAVKDKGSYRFEGDKDRLIKVANPTQHNQVLIMNSSHRITPKWEQELIDFLKIEKIESMGSIGVKIAKIAEGKAHYYFNLDSCFGIWDLVSPLLLLQEAGGYGLNAKNKPIVFERETFFYRKGLIASYQNNLALIFKKLETALLK